MFESLTEAERNMLFAYMVSAQGHLDSVYYLDDTESFSPGNSSARATRKEITDLLWEI